MAKKNQTKVIAETGKQEIIIIREFDAPRDRVFKAFTDPMSIVKWWGPAELKNTVEQYEPKAGGSWKFVQVAPNGAAFSFHGVLHEVSKERIIQTFEFDGLPEKGHVAMETMRLEELPGNRTRMTTQSVFQSVQDRDGMVSSGMERGVVESHERLDALLENKSRQETGDRSKE